MTAQLRMVFLLLAVMWAAQAVNWADASQWARTLIAASFALVCVHLYRR